MPVGDYLLARIAANPGQTTNLGVGNHIEFDSELRNGTSITLSTGAGQADGIFTLLGGQTYRIETRHELLVNEGFCVTQWRDDSDDSPIVAATGQYYQVHRMMDNVASDTPANHSSVMLYAPVADTDIKLDVVATGGLQTWYWGTTVRIDVWDTSRSYMFAQINDNPNGGAPRGQIANLSANNHVEFREFVGNGSDITLATGAVGSQDNGIFTLAGGKVYRIETSTGIHLNPGEAQNQMQWRLHPADTAVQDVLGEDNPLLRQTDNWGSGQIVSNHGSNWLFAPVADTDIKLDIVVAGTLNVIYPGTGVLIREITAGA